MLLPGLKIPIVNMAVKFSRRFSKQYDKCSPKVRQAFHNRLDLFLQDKFNPLLHNHALIGKYSGYRSINITGDWRALFQELEGDKIIHFDAIGTHSQLYR